MCGEDSIVLPVSLQERLLTKIKERWPLKSFGYILAADDDKTAADFILFLSNVRNVEPSRDRFHSYGYYFIQHHDAGFVATPEESLEVQKEIWRRGMHEIGVFHSHLRHPANFSRIDYDMHIERFYGLWHLIVSMRNPEFPQMRAYRVSHSGVRELRLLSCRSTPKEMYHDAGIGREAAISNATQVLRLDPDGRPACRDSKEIFNAIGRLHKTKDKDLVEELLVKGFLRDARQRFDTYVAPLMSPPLAGSFLRGSEESETRHFCGECPRRIIELSPFSISRVQVTNELLGTFDPDRQDISATDRQKPASNMTWFDATVFAMWMGCRLPTEAEWEFACGAGSRSEWCCDREAMLPRYAWYSENSGGELHAVGTREPNSLGLFDFHGNVWEWCEDQYQQDYFLSSPISNPVNLSRLDESADKICRGGSIHALAEMCRTRYRLHEPAEFWAPDLGFRLARETGSTPLAILTHG